MATMLRGDRARPTIPAQRQISGARGGLLGMTVYSAVAAGYMAVLGRTGAQT